MVKSPIDIANEQVSIVSVLLQMGIDIPDSSSGNSWKTHCPFEAFYHLDRGGSKALRVYYDSNTAYCFRGCGFLTPVTLFALKTGLSRADAALMLLQTNGIDLPSFDEQLQLVLSPSNSISKSSLREALQTFCKREVGEAWGTVQFLDHVIIGIDKCLKLLDKVDNEEVAKIWLAKSKQYMSALLKGTSYV